MTDDAKKAVGDFLDKFWEKEEGRVCLATRKQAGRMTRYLVDWPRDRQKVVNATLLAAAQNADVFFCPSVYLPDAPSAERAYVKSVNSHWVDFDGNAPADWEKAAKERGVPEPSLIIQSSVPGHQHAYWFIPRQEGDSLDSVENTTRNITAAFAADSSGWDLPQLLRIPGTFNYGWRTPTERKPWFKDEPVEALVLKDTPVVFTGNEFTALTNAERQILERIKITEVPDISSVLAYGNWSSPMFDLFSMTQEEASDASPNHRSGSLQRLAYYGAEQGFTDNQIYSILDDADRRWGKYITRSQAGRDKILRDTIARARTKIGYLAGDQLMLSGIMGDTETQTESPRFMFNYQEFLDAEFKVDWIIEDLMAVSGFGLIVGQPGVGKTRMAIQIGLDLATGREQILTYKNKSGPKRVCFLSLEMSSNPLSLFMHSFDEHYASDSQILAKNFIIVPAGQSIPLDQPSGQTVMKNILSTIKPDVLVVDSLQKSVSKPMTDEMAMKEFDQFVTSIRSEFSTAVYFVHHNRKKPNDGYVSAGDLSDVYGSQMLAADVDFVIGLAKAGTYVKLDEYKNRLSSKGELHDISLINDGIKFILQDGMLGGMTNGSVNGNTTEGGITF